MSDPNTFSIHTKLADNKPAQSDSVQEPAKPILGWEGLLLLGVALTIAGAYLFLHNPSLFSNQRPGIGFTFSQILMITAALVTAKRCGHLRARNNPGGWLLLALALALGCVYAVFANQTMRLLNLPVLVLLTSQALFTLTGQNQCSPLSGQGLWEGLRRFGNSLHRHGLAPFQAFSSRKRTEKNAELKLVGLFTAAITGIVALVLLSSADEVFSGMLNRGFSRVMTLDYAVFIKLALTLLLGLLLFSHLFTLLRQPSELIPLQPKEKQPTIFLFVLCTITVIYALFAYVQVRYLFLGTESVQMSGGYAAYARKGFFQLVAVALLTLCLIIPALILCHSSKPIRVLCALVTLLTALIDFSAFFRMRLYIEAYGLSTLRVVTLWGIGMILLALAASLWKSIRPNARICPLLAAVALCTWIALNWINVDRLVADNLVTRYNRGLSDWSSLESLMDTWSPDYYPSFEKIEDPSERDRALAMLDHAGQRRAESNAVVIQAKPPLYDWSLSYLQVKDLNTQNRQD